MKRSVKIGFCFGLTSGIITTLGLMVGLNSGTHSKMVVIGGILTIAIADAFSDALGIHISEESQKKNTPADIWKATISTWVSKFVFALTFAVPVLLLDLNSAIIAGIIWGLGLLGILSYFTTNENKWKAVLEHMAIAIIVIIITHFVGEFIGKVFV
ncbi:hypothetical protein GF345_06200 [Candidatus Woesearchaeota archaeon]|nr:hypothetical protein [Candidatus Woesearchaeota archaeon]